MRRLVVSTAPDGVDSRIAAAHLNRVASSVKDQEHAPKALGIGLPENDFVGHDIHAAQIIW